jgi:hypothetical protein
MTQIFQPLLRSEVITGGDYEDYILLGYDHITAQWTITNVSEEHAGSIFSVHVFVLDYMVSYPSNLIFYQNI